MGKSVMIVCCLVTQAVVACQNSPLKDRLLVQKMSQAFVEPKYPAERARSGIAISCLKSLGVVTHLMECQQKETVFNVSLKMPYCVQVKNERQFGCKDNPPRLEINSGYRNASKETICFVEGNAPTIVDDLGMVILNGFHEYCKTSVPDYRSDYLAHLIFRVQQFVLQKPVFFSDAVRSVLSQEKQMLESLPKKQMVSFLSGVKKQEIDSNIYPIIFSYLKPEWIGDILYPQILMARLAVDCSY